MHAARRLLLLLCALALLAAGATLFVLGAPFGPTTETFVEIPPSTGTQAIATELQAAGIIRGRLGFLLLHLIHHGSLRAGEYRFDHPLPLTEVYQRLRRGDVYTLALAIPEGFNLFDIAQAAEHAGLGPRAGFLAAARQHTELVAGLSPHAPSLEGFLFPATYRFSRHATPPQMLAAMVHRFRQAATQLGLQGNVTRTLILASLVEKEVAEPAERPLVAGVFTNRLARGMPLETDPAVVYAALLENRYQGTIYRSDLNNPNPYNTYRHTGLPPGPICNPGVAALQAALHPTHTDFLYFVSDAAGHTRFSVDLREHAEQVAAYRQALHPAH